MVYLPPHFEETDVATIQGLIREHPLGTLVTVDANGLNANHIPFILDTKHGAHGRLLAHVARKNAVWRDRDDSMESLVIFQSANAYITPNWYATKRETHEVVPTWNYAVVHVYGNITVHDDVKWIRGQAGMLTKQQEATQPQPWKMADAPAPYTETMLRNIVGLEIEITRVIAKCKASQNRSDIDREGAIAGLLEQNTPSGIAMAAIMKSQAKKHSL